MGLEFKYLSMEISTKDSIERENSMEKVNIFGPMAHPIKETSLKA